MDASILPSELLEVLRLSLKATAFDASTANDGETFDPRNPALRKLVEAILYSRKFVLTYYIVLAGLLVCYTSVRLTKRLLYKYKRRRTTSGVATPASYDSSSSTLREDAALPDTQDEERKPLLNKSSHQPTSHNNHSTSILRTTTRHIKSLLHYQPAPIPALTSPTNTLPSNSTTLTILAFLALNIFYILFHTPLTIPMLFALADRAGVCFAMNLPLLYLLAAKTNQPLQLLTGWSYEGLNIFHRRLGEWMTFLAVVHAAGMLGVWYTLLRPLDFTLWRFLSGKVGSLGVGALVCYLGIWGGSVGWVRKLWYEVFLAGHVVLQVGALVFLFLHHHGSRPYVLASLGVWVVDRVVVRNLVAKRKYIATLEVAKDGRTVLLHATVHVRSGWLSRGSIANGWKASQHVFVTVPGMGYVKHRLQTHPFTIASPAPPNGYAGPWQLQLIIRAQDGFSKDLLEYAKFHQHTEILLDGPYGSTDALDAMKQADRVCLIAGGSGIAVTYPLAWALRVRQDPGAVLSRRTVYENGQRVLPQIQGLERVNDAKHSHIWIRQDFEADQWLAYAPRLDAVVVQEGAAEGLTPVVRYSEEEQEDTRAAADLMSARFSTGGVHALRPDVGVEVRECVCGAVLVKDGPSSLSSSSGGVAAEKNKKKHLVIVSGPDGLVRAARNCVAGLVREGGDVEVFVEKFGW